MKIRYEVISDVGRTRANNEDMALVMGELVRDSSVSSMVPMKTRPRFSALVADGMGGYGGGEVASEMVLKSFDAFLDALAPDLTARGLITAVKEWFQTVQTEVRDKAATSAELANMGTTLTGIFTYGPWEFMLNAGDSRVYRLRYETLRQLSTDHSERQRTGDMSLPANLIYNAVGVAGAFVDVTNLSTDLPLIDGDVLLICSDGLCDMISDAEIESILNSGGGARRLVDAALEAGGADNCTVILLRISIPEHDEVPEETAENTPQPTEPPATLQAPEEPASLSDQIKPLPLPKIIVFNIDEDDNEHEETSEVKLPEVEIPTENTESLPPDTPPAPDVQKSTGSSLRDALRSLFGKK